MTALSVTAVTKAFAGVVVLHEVDLAVERGQIHALLGGNGSGKSTLIKILAGVYQADSGGGVSTRRGSVPATSTTPEHARALGLRFVHQNLGLIPTLSIAENMALATSFPMRGPQIRWRELREWSARHLSEFGITADPDTPVGALRPAEQTLVAVARALSDRAEVADAVLVLDEPTATLPRHEVDMLFAALRASSQAGQTILIVSHRIDEVMSLADCVTVLRDGHVVGTDRTSAVSPSALVAQIVGHPVEVRRRHRDDSSEDSMVVVRNLKVGPVKSASFEIRQGEILGLAGALGSGRSEILRSMFGQLGGRGNGDVLIDGKVVDRRTPAHAVSEGLAYVPEDRASEGIFRTLAVFENITVSDLSKHRRRMRVASQVLRVAARALMKRFLVRADDEQVELQYLSGGNQQKVVLARCLSRSPRLILLDEPTQGVDVGAREEIHALIRDAVRGGTAVLAVSSDYDELAALCDRVLVLRDGHVADELTGNQLTAASISAHVHVGEAA